MVGLEKWKTLSRRDQLGHIASEIRRAMETPPTDVILRQNLLERAIALIDLSLLDDRFDKLTIKKWRVNPLMLLRLREELAAVYVGKEKNLQGVYAVL